MLIAACSRNLRRHCSSTHSASTLKPSMNSSTVIVFGTLIFTLDVVVGLAALRAVAWRSLVAGLRGCPRRRGSTGVVAAAPIVGRIGVGDPRGATVAVLVTVPVAVGVTMTARRRRRPARASRARTLTSRCSRDGRTSVDAGGQHVRQLDAVDLVRPVVAHDDRVGQRGSRRSPGPARRTSPRRTGRPASTPRRRRCRASSPGEPTAGRPVAAALVERRARDRRSPRRSPAMPSSSARVQASARRCRPAGRASGLPDVRLVARPRSGCGRRK